MLPARSFLGFLTFGLLTACGATPEARVGSEEKASTSATCEGLDASQCLADARCEPELGGCPSPPPGVACSPTFLGCKAKVAQPDPCAVLAASECLADARCEPKLEGCATPPPTANDTCSPTFAGCQSKR